MTWLCRYMGSIYSIISILRYYFYHFRWMGDIFKKGVKSDLAAEDLYDPLKGDLSEPLGDELEKNWTKEVLAAKEGQRKPSLLRAIRQTFFWSYMAWGVLEFIQAVILR